MPYMPAQPDESDQHAGADLAECRRLLVDRNADARPGQRGRGGKSADAAAHYRRRQPLAHPHHGILT
jgi:hypothetical protein